MAGAGATRGCRSGACKARAAVSTCAASCSTIDNYKYGTLTTGAFQREEAVGGFRERHIPRKGSSSLKAGVAPTEGAAENASKPPPPS